MAADKQVEVKILTGVEGMEKVTAIEDTIKKIKMEKLQLQIDANTSKLKETEERIESLKIFLDTVNTGNTNIKIDDSQIKKAEAELESLESEKIDIALAVETDSLEKAKAEVEELDDTSVDIDIQASMQNFSQGLSQAKQGISELKQNMDDVAQAGMQSEQNKAFLEMNLGADKAKQTYQDISDIVASMPGDDNTMRSVLSTAQALGNNLNKDEMTAAAKTMADYMSGSATMGKMATESQQDIMKYLLDGNTAELERGSIVSSQVDKLKEATTFQERQAAMQEVLNGLGYGGISQQDTMLNKQAEWEGMLYNSQDALSSMWLEGEKGAMDYILKLNDASGGIVGMGIVAAQMAGGPLVELVGGLGQMAVGMKAIKDLNMIKWLKDLEIMTKLSAAADWLLAGAQQVLNFVMYENPILLVVLALALLVGAIIWAYYNVDWFREMVDNAWQSLVQLGQQIYGAVSGAIQWLGDLFNQFTSQLGLNTQDWKQAVLGFILFLPQLPLRVGQLLLDTIAKALGFGDNFTQTMIDGASNAVNGFVSWIVTLPGKLYNELQKMLKMAADFAMKIADTLSFGGASMVTGWQYGSGEQSPGYMYDSLSEELSAMEKLPGQHTGIISGMRNMGRTMSSNFNPELPVVNGSIASIIGGGDTVINIYGDVDSDSRVRQIVEAIRRELNFDNRTAGRSV